MYPKLRRRSFSFRHLIWKIETETLLFLRPLLVLRVQEVFLLKLTTTLKKRCFSFFFSKGVNTLALDIFFPLTKNKSLTDVRTLKGTFKKRAGILTDIQKTLIFFEELSFCRKVYH